MSQAIDKKISKAQKRYKALNRKIMALQEKLTKLWGRRFKRCL